MVAEIEAMGGEAMSNYGDVSSWSDCEAMIKATLDRFGDLHALVCNAGVLRDRLLRPAALRPEPFFTVKKVWGWYCFLICLGPTNFCRP